MGNFLQAVMAARPDLATSPIGSIPTTQLTYLYQAAAGAFCSANPGDENCLNPALGQNLISGLIVAEDPTAFATPVISALAGTNPTTLVLGGNLGITVDGKDAAGNQYPLAPGYQNVYVVPITWAQSGLLPPPGADLTIKPVLLDLRIPQYVRDPITGASVPTGQYIAAGYIVYQGSGAGVVYSNTFGIPTDAIPYKPQPGAPITLPPFLSAASQAATAATAPAPGAVTPAPAQLPGQIPITRPPALAPTPAATFAPSAVPVFTPATQRLNIRVPSAGTHLLLLPAGGGIGTVGSGLASVATFGVSIIATILGSLFGSLFGGNDTANQINQLRSEMSQAVDTLMRFAWKVAGALGSLLTAIEHIWVTMLHRLWDMVKWFGSVLRKLLTDVLPKVITALQNLRKLMQYVYLKYLRPALVYIQLIRRYLAILRLLHVPFAAKLDRILVQIQGRILAPYFWILRQLNGYGGWLNVILTAGAIMQRAVFINTMYAYQADWINMWWVGQSFVTPSGPPTTGPAAPGPPTQAQVAADFQAYVQADAGPYAAVAARAQQLAAQSG